MKQFLTLLKFEFASDTARFRSKTKLGNFSNVFFGILKALLLIMMSLLLSSIIFKEAKNAGVGIDFLVLSILLLQVYSFVYVFVGFIKAVPSLRANKQLLFLPVAPFKTLFVKFAYFYLKQIGMILLVGGTILLNWAAINSAELIYYFVLLPSLILLPIIPSIIAALTSFFVAKLLDFIKQNLVLSLIFQIVFISAAFYLYVFVLQILFGTVSNGSFNTTNPQTLENFQNFVSQLHLAVLAKNVLLSSNLFKSVIVLTALAVVLALLTAIIAKTLFLPFLQRTWKDKKRKRKLDENIKHTSVFFALVKKEFVITSKTKNNAFSFFTVALTTPLLVLFSANIFEKMGFLTNSFKSPFIILLLSLFMLLVTSFAAIALTQEQKSFNLTKILPVAYKKQVQAKIFMYLSVELFVILITCTGLISLEYVGFWEGLLIGLLNVIIACWGIYDALNLDLNKPQFKAFMRPNDEQGNSNMAKSVFRGLLVVFTIGVLAILLSRFIQSLLWYLPLFVVTLCLCFIFRIKLFKTLKVKYEKIEF